MARNQGWGAILVLSFFFNWLLFYGIKRPRKTRRSRELLFNLNPHTFRHIQLGAPTGVVEWGAWRFNPIHLGK
ncbi:hypothetical protein A3765_09805 [Oleiphilus sp. HI0130]|nr:hypothetical protein A3744_11010 [Oleiphilus sp. HI0073]KZZ13731.1 hypothetical protein A3750_02985 [Oleiphilus sp. HI0079]KZZ40561.1 hypothetical protein A3758_07455 [Oleiphilus sp. HI0118]KZZ53067.1 hypothetical protein A3758_28145 [Oleiphilus sp. HI0118]KZZ76610.1 hypothetical protein A3765_09805 [Oleiphilus sp. HI0130]